MDETLKVIIGTLAGFTVAFFAEPVKLFFQNSAQKKNLRTALYNEILSNYVYLAAIYNDGSQIKEKGVQLSKLWNPYFIKTNCYEYAISQYASLFYQLKEATVINGLYGLIYGINNLSESQTPKSQERKGKKDLYSLSKIYTEQFILAIRANFLDEKILAIVAGKQKVESLKQIQIHN